MGFNINKIKGELVAYKTSDGLELHGFLIKSRSNPKKIVVHIHGLTGNFFRKALPHKIAQHCLSVGYDFLIVNTRGHGTISWINGAKLGKRKNVEIGTALERFEDCVQDLKGVIDFLASTGYKKIILQGHSTGCQKSIYYIYKTQDKRVSAIVLLAPADDYNANIKILGRKWKKAVNFAKKIVQKTPNKLMPLNLTNNEYLSAQRFLSLNDLSRVESRIFNYGSNLKEFGALKLPILAIFGSKDESRTKPVKLYLKKLAAVTASRNFVTAEIKHANHSFKNYEAKTARVVVNWLKQY